MIHRVFQHLQPSMQSFRLALVALMVTLQGCAGIFFLLLAWECVFGSKPVWAQNPVSWIASLCIAVA